MKKFWLVSVIGLASYVQASASANITISNGERTLTMNYVAPEAQVSTEDELNEAINRLTANAQRAEERALSATQDYYAHISLPETAESLKEVAPRVSNLGSKSAPSLAAQVASRAAHGRSQGLCARYVRKALQAAGYNFTPQPSAYMYAHGTLARAGFTKISTNNYRPQVGDIAVFNRSSKNPHGHIQIYNGSNWISDFRQRSFSPYAQHNGYTVWRDSRYVDASNNGGTYLAWNEQ